MILLGGLGVILVWISTHLFWFYLSQEGFTFDEASFLIFGLEASQRLRTDPASWWDIILSTVTFRPPLLSMQAAFGWLLLRDPVHILLMVQLGWAMLIVACTRAWELSWRWHLLWGLILLSPFFTAQMRQYHTDLGGAALTLASYTAYLKSSGLSRYRWVLVLGVLSGLGILMRIEFPINISPLVLHALVMRQMRWRNIIFRLGLIAVVAAMIAGPWYWRHLDKVRHWMTGGHLSTLLKDGGSHDFAIYFATRWEMLRDFGLLGLGLGAVLAMFWMPGFATSRSSKKHRFSRQFMLNSGLFILLVHLLIGYTGDWISTRMLLSATPLVLIGLWPDRHTRGSDKVLFAAYAGAWATSLYLSFFWASSALTGPRSYVLGPLPHAPRADPHLEEIWEAITNYQKLEIIDQPKIIVAGTQEFDVEAANLFNQLNYSYNYTHDYFTPESDLDNLYESRNVFILPDERFPHDYGDASLKTRRNALLKYIRNDNEIKLVSNFQVNSHYGMNLFLRQKQPKKSISDG